MGKHRIVLTVLSVVIAAFPLLAQEPNPTCNRCPATYIPKSELDAYMRRALEHHIMDQQVRSVDSGKCR